MGDVEFLPLLMRWIHVVSAIVAVGGATFMWLVLHPAAARYIPDEEETGGRYFRDAIRRRWMIVIHVCIAGFLVSGFYNFFAVTLPEHQGQWLYHALFGLKFLLSLPVFFLAIGLSSTRPWAQRFAGRPRTWLAALLVMAFAVVLLGGFMRMMPGAEADDTVTPVADVESIEDEDDGDPEDDEEDEANG